MDPNKSVLVIGTGSIGGYVGGSLAAAGHRVCFLSRPQTAALIRKEGFRLVASGTATVITPEIFTTADEVFNAERPDLIVLAVKRYDTSAAVSALTAYAAQLPPILNLQNGVGAETDVADLLGIAQLIPGTVTTAVGRPKPNEVVVERFRGLGIANSHPDADYWVDACNRAGLGARRFEDALSMKWSKLLTNLIANPVSAICDMSPAEIFAHKGLFRLEMLQLREALSVMRGIGADVVDLPGTPVRLLALCAKYLPLSIARPLLGQVLAKGRGGKMPSFHGDLHGGSGKTEVGYLHGAVVREGARLGIPTPVNHVLVETLTALISGRSDKDAFRKQPDLLLQQLN